MLLLVITSVLLVLCSLLMFSDVFIKLCYSIMRLIYNCWLVLRVVLVSNIIFVRIVTLVVSCSNSNDLSFIVNIAEGLRFFKVYYRHTEWNHLLLLEIIGCDHFLWYYFHILLKRYWYRFVVYLLYFVFLSRWAIYVFLLYSVTLSFVLLIVSNVVLVIVLRGVGVRFISTSLK